MAALSPARGRGAQSNASGRFEAAQSEPFDDGWTEHDAEPGRIETTLLVERPKTIINKVASEDIGFDRSINPYRGCEHGCIYCYARPTHAYYGYSPGLDFETKLIFKPDAAKLLEQELSKPRYVCKPIHIGGNTDPYQPIERGLKITRSVLEVLDRFNHPFSIISKNASIVRDLDILAAMAKRGLVRAALSVTTLDRKLARSMEPRSATPERRLQAVAQLAAAGVPCSVSVAPIIPGLTDHEIEAIVVRAAAAGAAGAHYTLLRLPLEIAELFREWLAAERPDRAARVMSLVRQTRGGKDYQSAWNVRMKGEGPLADLIGARFRRACERAGLNRDQAALDTSQFRVPTTQLDLF